MHAAHRHTFLYSFELKSSNDRVQAQNYLKTASVCADVSQVAGRNFWFNQANTETSSVAPCFHVGGSNQCKKIYMSTQKKKGNEEESTKNNLRLIYDRLYVVQLV